MITIALLKFLEDNHIGTIDVDMFWQNIGLDAEGLYIVKMRYRGTNSFNAVVTEDIELIVDQNGNIYSE